MYYEVKNQTIDTLNQRIKNELIQAQKLEHQDITGVQKATPCKEQTSCKLQGIRIRQKIGFQEDLIPIASLTREAASLQVQRMLLILRMKRIILLFNDPHRDAIELYRFITEVFFEIELPPHPLEMQFCFIYDKLEDEKVGNPESLVRRVFEPLFKHGGIQQFSHLNSRIKLNEYENLSEPELHYVVDRYKSKYASIMNKEFSIATKQLKNDRLHMKGLHQTIFCNQERCDIIQGNWHLELIAVQGTWRVVNIQIEGVEF
jgi:hypothetical protein